MRAPRFVQRILKAMAAQQFEEVLRAYLKGTDSAAGIPVTDETAMRIAAVNACVRVIAETVASLPLNVYQRTDERSRIRAIRHPLYRLLHDQPNSWQTSFEFRELLQNHLCLRGRAYAYKLRVGGDISELIPLNPDLVTVEQTPDYRLVYTVNRSDSGRGPLVLKQEDVLHLRGLSSDGVDGRNVIADARETFGTALAMQAYAGRFFRNDATPSVVLSHPGKLSKEAADRLEESWNASHSGPANARRTAVIEEGMKVEKLSVAPEDAQFLESRKYTRSEIAGLFRVPPHMIGDLERSTFSNIEHQAIDFVTHCIRPWLVRWEQAMHRDLFIAPILYFPEFNVDALLRGDTASRYQAYAVGRQWGWLSANDIRDRENMNPIEGGDTYLTPANMLPATTSGETEPSATSGNGKEKAHALSE